MASLDTHQYAQVVTEVGIRVDKLLRSKAIRKRFQEVLRQWSRKRATPTPRLDCLRLSKSAVPVPQVPVGGSGKWRPLALAEQYSMLAGIRDSTCEGVKRVNLWGGHERRISYVRAKAAILFRSFVECALCLQEDQRPALEKVLGNVIADLRAEGLIGEVQTWKPAPAQLDTRSPERTKPGKRSRTQGEVDDAIWEFKAERAKQYRDLVDGVKAGHKGAVKDARKLFGCRAISRKLKCSTAFVSRSPAWRSIADELGLGGEKPGGRAGGATGLEIAAERAAVAEHRATGGPAKQAEDRELTRLIREQRMDQRQRKVPKSL